MFFTIPYDLYGADFYDRLPDVQFCEGSIIISASIYFFQYLVLALDFSWTLQVAIN